MKHKTAIVVVTLMLILFQGSLVATAQGDEGTIQGQVVNWTRDGGSVEQVEVTLNSYKSNVPLSATIAETDAEGAYIFTELSTEADQVYQLELMYQGAAYLFEPVSFSEGELVKTANLVVYDSASSDQAITIDRAHIIIQVDPQVINVTEYLLFVNSANTTYIGAEEIAPGINETLKFSLSQKAIDFGIGGELAEWSIYPTEDGFVDTQIFLPGTKEILYTYSIDYESDSHVLPIILNYPVKSFDLMVEGENVQVSCEQLIPGELPGGDDAQISYYIGRDIGRNTAMNISFTGLEGPGGGGSTWQFIVPVALVCVLGLGFLIWWKRRRDRIAAMPVAGGSYSERDILLQDIARLDDSYERGDIKEEDYVGRRLQMKERLMEFIQGQDE